MPLFNTYFIYFLLFFLADIEPEIKINYESVPSHQLEAAKVLFETVACVLNRAVRTEISINSNFFDIGGNSLNTIYTISKLNEQGYYIGKLLYLNLLYRRGNFKYKVCYIREK